MSANPRNKTTESNNNTVDTSEWKSLGLGSGVVYVPNSKNHQTEADVSFAISKRNALAIRDLANAVLESKETDAAFTLRLSPFFDKSKLPEKMAKHFSHRLYTMRDNVEKFGLTFDDYVTIKS